MRVDDGTVGPMLAGNPLRVIERERSGVDGDRLADVKDFLRRVRGVDGEGDGLREGDGGEGEAEREGGEAEAAKGHAGAPGVFGHGGMIHSAGKRAQSTELRGSEKSFARFARFPHPQNQGCWGTRRERPSSDAAPIQGVCAGGVVRVFTWPISAAMPSP